VGKGSVRRARKRIEEVVEYALGHRTRIQILTVLNDGVYSSAEISQIIGVSRNTVRNHLRQMVEDGSVEIDSEVETGNHRQYRYRAVAGREYSAEEFERLPYRQRQHIAGAFLSAGIAEVMAGFHAGKLAEPSAHLYSARYKADEKGRGDIDDLVHRFLRGLRQIEDESIARVETTGGSIASMFLNLTFFERPRKGSDRLYRQVSEREAPARPHPLSERWRAPRRFFGWGDHRPPSI